MRLNPLFHRRFALACVVAMLAGMQFVLRGLLSVGMIAMVVNGIVYAVSARRNSEKIFRSEFFVGGLIFAVYALSGLYSDHGAFWQERVMLKLPFLLLPIGFLPLMRLQLRTFNRLLVVFVLLAVASAVYVLMVYAAHRADITYWTGEVMETPGSHVRFSLIVAFAVFVCLHLWLVRFQWLTKFDRWVMLVCGALLFVFLHVLAVRSGLLAFYASSVLLAFWFAVTQRRWMLGLSFVAACAALPVLAYWFVPTFHDKVNYMRYDVNQLSQRDARNTSDGPRIVSIRNGLKLFCAHPLIGVGVGNMPVETATIYNDNTMDNLRMPHNQWVWCLAAAGLIGTLFVAFAMFFPMYRLRHALNVLTISFFTIMHTSFFTEATLEEQIGTAFYLVFLLLLLCAYRHD